MFVVLSLMVVPAHAINLLENAGIIDGSMARGSFLAVTDGGYAMFNNPAVLARVGEDRTGGGRAGLVLGGLSFSTDIMEGYGSVAQARDLFGWGIGLHYYAVGSKFGDDFKPSDVPSGHDFWLQDYQRITVTGSFGKKAFIYTDDKGNKYSFSAGVQTKLGFVTSERDTFDFSGNFFAADLGMIGSITLQEAPYIKDFRAGLVLENFPSFLFGDDVESDDQLPSYFRINASLMYKDMIQPSVDLRIHALSAGVAYWYQDDSSARVEFTLPSDGGAVIGAGINKRFGNSLIDAAFKTQEDVGFAINLALKAFWGKTDACPGEPEDYDGYMDDDGCPDLDNDGDGVLDENDACPNDSEDFDDFQDKDGCPDLDNDNDGIADYDDSCPNDAEDRNGYADDDGCPDDKDGDGVFNENDQCADQAETRNFYKDDDGCPDEFLEDYTAIRFERNQATISSNSYSLIYEIGNFLAQNPSIRVEIGVFDNNQRLARERANEIRDFLLKNYDELNPDHITARALSQREGLRDVFFRFQGNN